MMVFLVPNEIRKIKIVGGPYKGNISFVKDATVDTVRVELHCPSQTISVDVSHIRSTTSDGKVDIGTSDLNYTRNTFAKPSSYPLTTQYMKDTMKSLTYGFNTTMYDGQFYFLFI